MISRLLRLLRRSSGGAPETPDTPPDEVERIYAAALLNGLIEHREYRSALEQLAAAEALERPLDVPGS
ncbi:hypothetical protein [Streptomyces sp. NPDC020742]|uniref:hypothetical protein n=1 Tax=unclassified Streptomyces TaxID=2593676 RepID=UPI0033D9D7DD